MRVINGIKLYSEEETAAMLEINRRTLTNIRKRGEIKSVNIGRRLWTSEEAINNFLTAKTK